MGKNHEDFPHFQRNVNVTNFLNVLVYLTLPGESVLCSSGVGCKPYILESAALNITAIVFILWIFLRNKYVWFPLCWCGGFVRSSYCSLIPFEHNAGPDRAAYSVSDAQYGENGVRDVT